MDWKRLTDKMLKKVSVSRTASKFLRCKYRLGIVRASTPSLLSKLLF
jgi:hypothetical protein